MNNIIKSKFLTIVSKIIVLTILPHASFKPAFVSMKYLSRSYIVSSGSTLIMNSYH